MTATARANCPEELVTLFSSEVWRFVSAQIAKREDAEDAEDVVMEVFAAAFADFRKVHAAEDQRLWLLAIARKKAADCLRKRYRRAEQPLSDLTEATEQSGPTAAQLATRQALSRLPEHQRQVLILKYVSGLSTEEIGSVTRRSLAATNSLLQRARESLRAALGGTLTNDSGETR